MQAQESPLTLIDTAEAARAFGRSEKTLIRWRRLRIGPPYIRLPTGRVLYDRSAICNWLQDQQVQEAPR